MFRKISVATVLGLGSLLPNCGAEPADRMEGYDPGNVGSVALELTSVPSGVTCVRVVVTGSQVVTRDFTVTANASTASLNLDRLPMGIVNISASAYNVACSSANAATPTWLADSTTAVLNAGVVSTVAMTFRKNNQVTASANFVGNVQDIAAGEYTTMVVVDGAVWQWGLGIGASTSLVPSLLAGLTSVSRISVGTSHACAIKTDGSVWCWGSNSAGQIGNGAAIGSSSNTPVRVGTSTGYTHLALGSFHSCGYRANAMTLGCWGSNFYGQLGDGTTTNSATPVSQGAQVRARSLDLGTFHSCYVEAEGYPICIGNNEYGKLGDGTTTNHSTYTFPAWDAAPSLKVCAGYNHTCALKPDGKVMCWGLAAALDDGTVIENHTPVDVPSISTATDIDCGGSHACAILQGGGVVCWGENYDGQLGDRSTVDALTPVQVANIPAVQKLAAGHTHTCALTVDQNVYCWGNNDYGQLGDGTYNFAFSPARVTLN